MKKLIIYFLVMCLLIVPLNTSAHSATLIEHNTTPTVPHSNESIISDSQFATTASTDLSVGTTSGYLDVVDDHNIGGWAWNNAYPNTSIYVDFYLGRDGNLSFFNRVTAGSYRSDLAQAGYGNGYHGFNCPVSWLTSHPGQYAVCAYGINNTTNPILSGSPKYFTVDPAQGYLEIIDDDELRGWAWKPDAPNGSISAHAHIKNANGELLDVLTMPANIYRADLEQAGYGNGYHGFYRVVDWDIYPHEALTVELYAVDESGYHPCFYSRTIDNRKRMYLIGQNDLENNIKFLSWMNSEVVQDCKNIGTSRVVKCDSYNKDDAIHSILKSYFCLINAHGYTDGSGIACVKDNIEMPGLRVSDLLEYSNTFFSETKCVTLLSCDTALGGTSNQDNFVNTLHSKGVEIVVGFKNEVTVHYNSSTGQVNDTVSSGLWGKKYISYLGEGYTVSQAVVMANTEVLRQSDGATCYGFDSYYIAGNGNQVIKH